MTPLARLGAALSAAYRAAVQPATGRAMTTQQLGREMALSHGTASGARVDEESALTVAAVWACVRIISQATAMLPLNVKQRDGDREWIDAGHPLYRVLALRPNSWQTPYEFQQMLQCHLLLFGNFYGFVSRYAGVVKSIIPLDPREMEVEQLDDFSLTYTRRHKGELTTFDQREILHVRGISLDGVLGRGSVDTAREDIGLAMSQARYGANFFRHAARPSGMLKSDKPLSEDAAQRLKAQFDLVFSGVDNAHRTIVLEQGMDWVKVGFDAEEAQYIQSRKFSRSEIAMFFGVPPHMLGDVDRSTSWGSGIQQQSLGFLIYVVRPWLVNIAQCVTRDLIAEGEQGEWFADFDTDPLSAGDPEIEAKVHQTYLAAGVLNVNEVRARLHYNPVDGGDQYLLQAKATKASVIPLADATRDVQAEIDAATTKKKDAGNGGIPASKNAVALPTRVRALIPASFADGLPETERR